MPPSSAVLLFGGSFDPIHNGHLAVATSVANQLSIPRILLIPCASPPHKPAHLLSPATHRLEMCRLAATLDPRVSVSDWEARQPGPNYTLLTIRHFQNELPGARLHWLIGMDSLNELHTWYKIGDLADACTLVTAGRPGFHPDLDRLASVVSERALRDICDHILETPLIDVSSTNIRARVRCGQCIGEFVPPPVAEYIRKHDLYR